jgi:predicted metalloprotease
MAADQIRRRWRWRTVTAWLAAALLAGACLVPGQDGADGGAGSGAESGGPAASPDGADPSGAGEQEDGTMTVGEFRADIAAATTVARDYWQERLADSGEPFRPIRQVIAYTRAGEVDCGGQPLGRNNAAYCSAGDFIAYDVRWAVGAFRQIGDAFLFYLLGHEYAHGIQVRLGIRYRYTIEQELQADCMAGAYIGDSVREGRLRLAAGDLDELRRGLFAVGDAPGQPWFAEGAHGTPEQRTEAFFNGYERSLRPCDL